MRYPGKTGQSWCLCVCMCKAGKEVAHVRNYVCKKKLTAAAIEKKFYVEWWDCRVFTE